MQLKEGGKILEHKHLIVRAEVYDPIIDPHDTERWMERLIDKIGMEIEAGPFVAYNPDLGNRGVTGVCLIKTSHIAMHIWDEVRPALVQLDVYSCSHLDPTKVSEALQEMSPHIVEWKFIDRENGLFDITGGIVRTPPPD